MHFPLAYWSVLKAAYTYITKPRQTKQVRRWGWEQRELVKVPSESGGDGGGTCHLTWVGAFPEHGGKVFVQQEVLHVAHLVVHRDKVVHGHVCALLDSF